MSFYNYLDDELFRKYCMLLFVIFVTVYNCILLYITLCYCMLLHVTVYHCIYYILLYFTVCYCILLYITVCYLVLLCVTMFYYMLPCVKYYGTNKKEICSALCNLKCKTKIAEKFITNLFYSQNGLDRTIQ